MYETMEICSRTLQVFFCLFLQHDLLRNPESLIAPDLWPSSLQTPQYVGADTLQSILLAHSKLQCSSRKRRWKEETSEALQTQTAWRRLCRWWSQHKMRDNKIK